MESTTPNTPKLTRAEAARINGAKSRGPVTPEGKQRASLNALKLGIYTTRVLIPGESKEEFTRLACDYIDEFDPQTPLEHDLVQDLIHARWRIRRMERTESFDWALTNKHLCEEYNLHEATIEEQLTHSHRHACASKVKSIEVARRAEARYHRDFDRALKTLMNLRKQKSKNEPNEIPAQPEPAPLPSHDAPLPSHDASLPSHDASLPSHDREGVAPQNSKNEPNGLVSYPGDSPTTAPNASNPTHRGMPPHHPHAGLRPGAQTGPATAHEDGGAQAKR